MVGGDGVRGLWLESMCSLPRHPQTLWGKLSQILLTALKRASFRFGLNDRRRGASPAPEFDGAP
jgi:hypothetical protein